MILTALMCTVETFCFLLVEIADHVKRENVAKVHPF